MYDLFNMMEQPKQDTPILSVKEKKQETGDVLEVFIPIKKDNIAHYFSTGAILPKDYLNNSIEDTQNLLSGYILVSKQKQLVSLKKMKAEYKSDCLISVKIQSSWIFNEGQTQIVINKPIPLSRVNVIYTKDLSDVERILENINMQTSVGGAAFIDKSIFQEDRSLKDVSIIMDDFDTLPIAENLDKEIDKFNRLMGAISFIKYYNNGLYNKAFFDELSFLNVAVKNELERATNRATNVITPRLTNHNLECYGTDEYREEINKINKKEKPTGDGRFLVSKDGFSINDNVIDGLKILYNMSLIGEHISDECQYLNSDILFLYGYSKGYSNLRSFYGDKKVKFDLNSYIDRIAIEIIFQYAILNKKDTDLSIFENLKQPLEQIKNIREELSRENNYRFENYYLFDALKPISILDFAMHLECYPNDIGLLKKTSKIVKRLSSENSITDDLKQIGHSLKYSLPDFEKNLHDMSKELLGLIAKQAEDFTEIQKKFLIRMQEIGSLRIKNDQLIEENQALKAKIKELESKGKK